MISKKIFYSYFLLNLGVQLYACFLITNQAPSLMFPVKNNEGPELNIQL